jgi:2-oxoisovalerate dehydrogenase E1 component
MTDAVDIRARRGRRKSEQDSNPPAPSADDFSDQHLRELYRALLLPRLIEEKMLRLLRQGKLSKWFSGIGQEAIAVGVTAALEADDYILPMHRNLGVFTTRGLDLATLFRQLLGKDGGFTRGRDRTFHFGSLAHHIVGMISHLGAMLPVADGLALAAQLRGERRVAATFTGDGSTSEGDFHEAANLAAVWKLPVLFVIENNHYGLSTPVSEQYACENLADRGVGYGMPGEIVDGNDLIAVIRAVRVAASRARRGEGPTLFEFKTFRMRGHEEASGVDYVPQALIEEWSTRDPLRRFEHLIESRNVFAPDERETLRRTLKDQIDQIADEALAAPDPTSTPARELADVYTESPTTLEAARIQGGTQSLSRSKESASPRSLESTLVRSTESASDRAAESARVAESGAARSAESASARALESARAAESGAARSGVGRELRYIDAISEGLREVMRGDSGVILLGQDIAEYGGVFKVTAGLVEEFGKERVRNTPIIESGAIGAALGLALGGFRPMVEMQFGDFISCGFNQIVNNLAKTHYRWGAAVPVVIRAPIGGGTGAGPFHSQNVEAWFTHVAGMKVVAPATPADAKGLLLAAFEDGNPVLYLEHKFLYRSAKGLVPEGHYTVPIGEAHVARAGRDATVVTYGVGVPWALDAAAALAADGIEIEVIDLRSLLPWDRERVLESIRRTSRALVLHEAPQTGGFGAEIAATISRDAFEWLDAPVARLGALDTPIPFSKALEEIFSPKGRLVPALRELVQY